jgi:hypothetical protein
MRLALVLVLVVRAVERGIHLVGIGHGRIAGGGSSER